VPARQPASPRWHPNPEIIWHHRKSSLLAANFFSKECLVIANAKGQYGGGRVGKKACRAHVSSHSPLC